jgi:acetyl esterase/lipase
VCPGGAYRRLALDHEGRDVAVWLNSLGVSAFVLKYRVKEYGHPAPLRDVLRAVRLLRADAAKWAIDPDRIGVLGFSAGGHLASSAGTLFDAPEGRTGADLDRVSARPDFLVLIYPVITLRPPHASASSRGFLIGENSRCCAGRTPVDRPAGHRPTPPTFLVTVGRTPACLLRTACCSTWRWPGTRSPRRCTSTRRAAMAWEPATAHVQWPRRCADWMAAAGLIAAAAAK